MTWFGLYSPSVIARTGNRLSQRWAVIIGQGEDAYLAGYALTRGGAEFRAAGHPKNCQPPITCPECNGARIILSEGGVFGPNGDECARCGGEGVVRDPLPHATEEIVLSSLPHLDWRYDGAVAVAQKAKDVSKPRRRLSGLADNRRNIS